MTPVLIGSGRFNLGRWLLFVEEDVPPNTANRSFALEELEGRRGAGLIPPPETRSRQL